MKKNISINISGIIFHIEEDGYEKLKKYLDSIHRYFASFDESSEIIADIESRIAEIFLGKLNEGKQVITAEDIDSLIVTMGSVKDFQAAEEETTSGEEHEYSYEEGSFGATKKLCRDSKRKILGGVSAGIAHYFGIDPLWIGLIFILLTVGSYGVALVGYGILWIVLPESTTLSEDQKLKKMYRNPQDKVIAGVSSGIAAYFGVDVTIIRLLFIVFAIVGGSGLIAYIILWIILPEAKSLTDRMQMAGDPITLSNIETNIKKSLDVPQNEDENVLTKIILFPFRIIAAIFSGLGRALGPLINFLVDFIRVGAGLILIFIGFMLFISTLITIGTFIGIWPAMNTDPVFIGFGDMGIPLEIIRNSFPFLTGLAAVFALAIPAFFLMLFGASIIAKKIVFNATTGWTLFAAFFISLVILSINIPAIVWSFQEDGEYRKEVTYTFDNKTPVISLKEVGNDRYDATELRIRGHEGSEILLIQDFESQGSSRMDAIEKARQIIYNVEQQDSLLIFDSNIRFSDDAVFRAQRLEMILYIPYNKEFIMEKSLRHILENTLYPHGYGVRDLDNNRWIFTEEGDLKCISCPDENQNYEEEDEPEKDTTQIIIS